MPQNNDSTLEDVKHRYRVREIWLDKGILAALIVIVVALANARVEEWRAAQERLRVLTESEVTAHEETWRALIKLRRFLAPLRDSSLDASTFADLTTAVVDFSESVEAQTLYLSDDLRIRLRKFVDPTLAEFVVSWQSSSQGPASGAEWAKIDQEFEVIGETLRKEVYDRRVAPSP